MKGSSEEFFFSKVIKVWITMTVASEHFVVVSFCFVESLSKLLTWKLQGFLIMYDVSVDARL